MRTTQQQRALRKIFLGNEPRDISFGWLTQLVAPNLLSGNAAMMKPVSKIFTPCVFSFVLTSDEATASKCERRSAIIVSNDADVDQIAD
jgi:hypothetical protein